MKLTRPDPKVVSAAMYEVLDNQLRDGEPPETRQTLERLLAEGHPLSEARRLIAAVVSTEIFQVLKYKRPYNEAGYVAALKRLPKMPWDK